MDVIYFTHMEISFLVLPNFSSIAKSLVNAVMLNHKFYIWFSLHMVLQKILQQILSLLLASTKNDMNLEWW